MVIKAIAEALEPVLQGYSGVYFSRKKGTALLFLAATLIEPTHGFCGLLCALVCALFLRKIGFDQASIRGWPYSVNALLVGLALARHFSPSWQLIPILVLAGVLTALSISALRSIFEAVFNLPQMSLAFVLITAFLYAAAGLPAQAARLPSMAWFSSCPPVEGYLRAVAAVFFCGGAGAGILVFAGLLYSSRIATVLSIIGYAAGTLAGAFLSPAAASGGDFQGYNYAVAAIAIGGIYSVPSLSSYGMAAMAAALCVPIGQGVIVAIGPQIGVLSMPFLAVTYLFIAGLRMRPANRDPELLLFPAASPEENLAIAHSHRLRQKGASSAGLRLPFIGAWRVTQGVSGEHTHIDKWRHALDFSLRHDESDESRPGWGRLSSFPAYGLPVISPQSGFVSKIVDGIPDNELGSIDTERNWGNYVSIQHDDGTFSLICHLKQGSIKVKPWQRVSGGEAVALCGNSGRSPTPHIHYHLQKTAEAGSETLPFAFSAYIEGGDNPCLREHAVPQKGQTVENLVICQATKAAFNFVTGSSYPFEVSSRKGRHVETLTAAMDLYGWRYLESDRDRSRLYYHLTHDMFYLDYCSAKPGSLLFSLFLAASKVPLVDSERLFWKDELPLNSFMRGAARLGAEFLLPFIPGYGVEVSRRFVETSRTAELKLVAVESKVSVPWPSALKDLTAQAVFCEGRGPVTITVSSLSLGVELSAMTVRQEERCGMGI
ncbi:MAG: urea transporter [Elusimicrobia bacterium]|nr:urea transporter [Elusimicrobiota bacterium]